jgi:hypothetical protein
MLKSTMLVVAILLLCAPCAPNTQKTQTPKKKEPSRSPFLLLPNYKLDVRAGFEGDYSGTVWTPDGLSIEYDVDIDAPRVVDAIEMSQIAWRLRQTLNGRSFDCIYTKSDEFVITSPDAPPANLRAKIRSRQELAEMLLMALSFDPNHGYAVDPGDIKVIH